MIKRLAAWIVMLDLAWNVALNVKNALLPAATPAPNDGLPVSPEFAFGWIQVLVNGGMALLVILSILSLFKMHRLGSHGYLLAPTIPRVSHARGACFFAAVGVAVGLGNRQRAARQAPHRRRPAALSDCCRLPAFSCVAGMERLAATAAAAQTGCLCRAAAQPAA